MSAAVVDSLRASGQLHDLIARAALDGLGPMCGVGGSVVGPISLPWSEPPSVLAVMSLTETGGGTSRSLAWIGGEFEQLAIVAEALLGERPVEEDELFEDCIQELANIVAGRLQEALGTAGIQTGLGLPIYISGARRLHVGATLINGAAMRVTLDLPDSPRLDVGFATEEEA